MLSLVGFHVVLIMRIPCEDDLIPAVSILFYLIFHILHDGNSLLCPECSIDEIILHVNYYKCLFLVIVHNSSPSPFNYQLKIFDWQIFDFSIFYSLLSWGNPQRHGFLIKHINISTCAITIAVIIISIISPGCLYNIINLIICQPII